MRKFEGVNYPKNRRSEIAIDGRIARPKEIRKRKEVKDVIQKIAELKWFDKITRDRQQESYTGDPD